MTVVLRHNPELEVNRVEYGSEVALAELAGLADFQAAHPTWLSYDSLSWVLPGAEFQDVDKAALDTLFARYKVLFTPLNLLILRRSAWICQSPAADAHVRHWLTGRATRHDVRSDVRLFDSFAEAGDWLVLTPEETRRLENGEGFREIARFETPVARARAS